MPSLRLDLRITSHFAKSAFEVGAVLDGQGIDNRYIATFVRETFFVGLLRTSCFVIFTCGEATQVYGS